MGYGIFESIELKELWRSERSISFGKNEHVPSKEFNEFAPGYTVFGYPVNIATDQIGVAMLRMAEKPQRGHSCKEKRHYLTRRNWLYHWY